MEIKMGEKIRTLRKQKNISQEVLAQFLGVSFQAAVTQKFLAADSLVAMLRELAAYYKTNGKNGKARKQLEVAKAVIEAFKGDDVKGEQHIADYYQCMAEELQEINGQLAEL